MKKQVENKGTLVNGIPVERWNRGMEVYDTDWLYLAAIIFITGVNIIYALVNH